MEKMIIKVTLNSRNPAEAELMGVLEDVRNRSAYLKMVALHYCNILGKLSHADERRNETGPDISKNGDNSDQVTTGKESSKSADEMKFDFSTTFKELE